jgi:hypothetical protein
MKYDLDMAKSKFADSLKAFGIKRDERPYLSPKEAFSAIERDARFRVKRMTTVQLEKIYSPLKELRDSHDYPLGSLEGIYQEARQEYLNREDAKAD